MDKQGMRLKKGDELLPMVKPTVYTKQSKEIKHQAQRIAELEKKLIRKQENVDDWVAINRDLIDERDQMKAVLGDIRQHAYRRLESNDFPQMVHPEALIRWVNKSPAACLAEHDGQIITKFQEQIMDDMQTIYDTDGWYMVEGGSEQPVISLEGALCAVGEVQEPNS